jgi:SNF2 family DNA or RNA helicase
MRYGVSKTKPWKHQIGAYNFLLERQFGALFMGMGTGKSKVIVDLIANRDFYRTLIVCPHSVGKAWVKQFTTHSAVRILVKNGIDLSRSGKVVALKRWLILQQKSVLIMNYESVWREPMRSFLLKNPPDCVVCDESHRIKAAGSKVSRFMHLLGKRVKNRFCLTGTPLAETPLDAYGQFRFMEPSVFGTNYGDFEEEYAHLIRRDGYNTVMKDRYGKPRYKNMDKFMSKLSECSFMVDESVLDLPPFTFTEVEYTLSSEAQDHYKSMLNTGMIKAREGVLTTQTKLEIITRLQQITCGYAPVRDDDKNTHIIEVDRGRINLLTELLKDIDPGEPVVVFGKYRKCLSNIREAASAAGRTSSELSGRVDELEDWQKGKTNLIAIQIQSGSEGIDLTRARICIYYSYSHSLAKWLQSLRRVRRPGQTRPVSYITIVANRGKKKTIDRAIIDAFQIKQEVIDNLMYELREEDVP